MPCFKFMHLQTLTFESCSIEAESSVVDLWAMLGELQIEDHVLAQGNADSYWSGVTHSVLTPTFSLSHEAQEPERTGEDLTDSVPD